MDSSMLQSSIVCAFLRSRPLYTRHCERAGTSICSCTLTLSSATVVLESTYTMALPSPRRARTDMYGILKDGGVEAGARLGNQQSATAHRA